MFTVHRILHPTDFGAHAESAFQAACDIARKYNAELLLVYVLQPEPAVGTAGLALLADSHARDMADEQMKCMAANAPDLKVQCYVADGETSYAIVEVAKEKDCDLIVIGSHGRRGIARLLLGSVAQDVLRRAPCPVLVVREPTVAASQTEPADVEKPAEHLGLEPFLADLIHVLKTHAHETERLIAHVETHTHRMFNPSEMGIVVSELAMLQARLDAACAGRSDAKTQLSAIA